MITSVVGMLKLPIFCHMTTSNSEPSDKILLVTPWTEIITSEP